MLGPPTSSGSAAPILTRVEAGAGDHDRRDPLAPALVGYAHDRRLGNGGILVQDRLDLARRDILPAGHDDVFLAIDDREVAALVEPAEIAGVEPAVDDCLRGRGGILEVAGHHLPPAHRDLAHLAGSHLMTVLVDDAELDERRRAAGASEDRGIVEAAHVIAGVEVRAVARQFGHAVALREAAPERVGALPEPRGGHGSRAVGDGAEGRQGRRRRRRGGARSSRSTAGVERPRVVTW